MSGGIDSSVAAALLLERGYDVKGVFMKFWGPGKVSPLQCSKGNNVCGSRESYQMARQVARQLGIKLYILNLKKKFWRQVVTEFINLHRLGVTPNPCVICNEKIKFRALLEKADSLGVDLVATGHYARITKDKKRHCLRRARDIRKDQSYFLYRLKKRQLDRILFPLGDYKKSKVRNIATKLKLPTATRRESQEVCFVPDNNLVRFLEKFAYSEMVPGDIVTIKGKKIGEHYGLPAYTIGQRRGICIGGIGPFYVFDKKMSSRKLIVTQKEEDLFGNICRLGDVTWIEKPTDFPLVAEAQIRYLAEPSRVEVWPEDKGLRVKFNQPQRAITPGQSVVFYKGDTVLGGGIIS